MDENYKKMDNLKAETKALVRELAAYQSLLIHFVKNNPDKKEFLNDFWKIVESIGNAVNGRELNLDCAEAGRLRAGILSQVAITHALEIAGHNPRIVHPDEDAFKKIDLRIGEGEKDVVQVKGTPQEMQVLEIDEIVLPGCRVKTKEGKFLQITNHLAKHHSEFREKILEYKERLKKEKDQKDIDIKGYMIAVPHREMDQDTGFPTEKFINFVKKEVKN